MTTKADHPATTHSRRITTLGVLFAGQGVLVVSFGAFSLFLPRIQPELRFDYQQAGIVLAGSTLVYALMQIPAGFLADRFGPRQIYVFGLAGFTCVTLAIASLNSYVILLVVMVLGGFFRSLFFTPGLLLVSRWFAPRHRATSMGGFIAGMLTFNALLALIGPEIESTVGWRTIFQVLSGLGLITTILFLYFASDPPVSQQQAPVHLGDVPGLFQHRFMWLIAGIQFVRLAVVYAFQLWLPTYLVADVHLSLSRAGNVVALALLLMALSNLVGGYVADRIRRPVMVIYGSLAVLTATCFVLSNATNQTWVLVAIAVSAFFMQFYFGPLFAVPVELLGPRIAGTASGFGNAFANMGGCALVFVLGAVKKNTGSFALGFTVLSVMAATGMVLGLLLACERRRILASFGTHDTHPIGRTKRL